ncbi:MAG TPA: hypothetical protein VK762_13975, partial [Polyangiaceae bacterium]|nr:hypothetical protein [Polyangiaceae bacterium]
MDIAATGLDSGPKTMRRALALAALALVAACRSSNDVPLDGASSDAAVPGDASTAGDAAAAAPEPSLMQELVVAPLALTPAFSPSIHDYFVRCAAGSNALTVSMQAASGGTVALLQPTTTAPAPSQTASVVVTEDQAVVVGASGGGVS